MNKPQVVLTLFGIGLLVFLLTPQSSVKAQDTCVDAAGGVIPCPATDEPQQEEPTRKPPTPIRIPNTLTFTPTMTATSTFTVTPSSTPTNTSTATAIPPTNTPTSTPIPPQGAAAWMPGIGIGAFILFIIVGILLPAVQKIRVSLRE